MHQNKSLTSRVEISAYVFLYLHCVCTWVFQDVLCFRARHSDTVFACIFEA